MSIKRFRSLLPYKATLNIDFVAEQFKDGEHENQDQTGSMINFKDSSSHKKCSKRSKHEVNGIENEESTELDNNGFAGKDHLWHDNHGQEYVDDGINIVVCDANATIALKHIEHQTVTVSNYDDANSVVIHNVDNDEIETVHENLHVTENDGIDIFDCNDDVLLATTQVVDHLIDINVAVNDHDNEIDFVVGYDVVVGPNNDQFDCNINDVAIESTVCCANDDSVDVCHCDDCFLQRVIPVNGPARRSCPGHSFIKIGMCTICGQSLDDGQDVVESFDH